MGAASKGTCGFCRGARFRASASWRPRTDSLDASVITRSSVHETSIRLWSLVPLHLTRAGQAHANNDLLAARHR